MRGGGARGQNLLFLGAPCTEAVGRVPSPEGKGGALSPCVGLVEDKTKDSVRGRRRWRRNTLSMGSIYKVSLQSETKNFCETHREGNRKGESLHRLYIQLEQVWDT